MKDNKALKDMRFAVHNIGIHFVFFIGLLIITLAEDTADAVRKILMEIP